LLLFFVLTGTNIYSQIYQQNFGTTAINTHPYNGAPAILDPNLSGSSWTNTTNTWTSGGGASGQALWLTTSGATTISLTFSVANNYEASISSFNFWRQRSNSASQNWSMAINGIAVGSGTIPTTGAATGTTNVSAPITGSGYLRFLYLPLHL